MRNPTDSPEGRAAVHVLAAKHPTSPSRADIPIIFESVNPFHVPPLASSLCIFDNNVVRSGHGYACCVSTRRHGPVD